VSVAETQEQQTQQAQHTQPTNGIEVLETREWLDSLDYVLTKGGPERAGRLLQQLALHARRAAGVNLPFSATTPYQNTIPSRQQPPFPGSQEMERRIKSLVRWNAMAMVVRANKIQEGIGGHISTFASAATLYEVGFNHFFRASTESGDRDIVYFQGHAAPGIYARAYLEGRIPKQKLENFRRELKPGGGLSSYPHPWLMPEFWEFPTVSMGLGPIQAIYHARFIKYLENRGLKLSTGGKVWAFMGDGEMDEPEALGSITLASRERLDNLIFVVNCNLQRLDGPVRGNGKIIQELEAIFRGAGWNVIKVIWGTDWDSLIQADRDGLLVRRMGEITDGQYQKYFVESGAYFRQNFFGTDPRLLKMVEHLSDEQLARMRLGGHDPIKVLAAYQAAVEHTGQPTIILAKTIKGYGLGEAGEGKNITHQQKKLNDDELQVFRSRFGIPIPDAELHNAPFYRPADDSAEIKYMQERRQQLGGYLPVRKVRATPLKPPADAVFEEFYKAPKAARLRRPWFLCGCWRSCCAIRRWGSSLCRLCPTRRARLAWRRCSDRWGFTRTSGSFMSRSTWIRFFITRRRRTGRFWKRGLPRQDRCARLLRRARPMPTTGSTRFRSLFITRCLDCSGLAT